MPIRAGMSWIQAFSIQYMLVCIEFIPPIHATVHTIIYANMEETYCIMTDVEHLKALYGASVSDGLESDEEQ